MTLKADQILELIRLDQHLKASLPESEYKYMMGAYVALETCGIPGDASMEKSVISRALWRLAEFLIEKEKERR